MSETTIIEFEKHSHLMNSDDEYHMLCNEKRELKQRLEEVERLIMEKKRSVHVSVSICMK